VDIDDVLDELVDAADALGIVAPNFGTSKGKAYEVWVMLEIVVRLISRGVEIFPLDRDGALEPNFRVSGSPADMPPSGGGGGGPCHFLLRKHGRYLELHLGLNHAGGSAATHEIDLSVLWAVQGKALRDNGGGPFAEQPLVGLELKAYSEKHKLDHAIARALIGVAVDLDPWWPMHSLTLKTPGSSEHTVTRAHRMHLAVLTTTELYGSSADYLAHYGAGAHSFVTPTINVAAIDAIVSEIDNRFH
jgi:hypothetical protein